MKAILKKAKVDEVPDDNTLSRMLAMINQCKSAALELAQFLHSTNWKYFTAWMTLTNKGLVVGKY